jgi:hypothetical protein
VRKLGAPAALGAAWSPPASLDRDVPGTAGPPASMARTQSAVEWSSRSSIVAKLYSAIDQERQDRQLELRGLVQRITVLEQQYARGSAGGGGGGRGGGGHQSSSPHEKKPNAAQAQGQRVAEISSRLDDMVGEEVATSIRAACDSVESKVRKRHFCAIYIQYALFYQDRLGTNIGKTQKRMAFSYRCRSS